MGTADPVIQVPCPCHCNNSSDTLPEFLQESSLNQNHPNMIIKGANDAAGEEEGGLTSYPRDSHEAEETSFLDTNQIISVRLPSLCNVSGEDGKTRNCSPPLMIRTKEKRKALWRQVVKTGCGDVSPGGGERRMGKSVKADLHLVWLEGLHLRKVRNQRVCLSEKRCLK